MKTKTDTKLINYFSKNKEPTKNTEKSYTIYNSKFNNMTMVNLIKEAENDEEQGIQ